MSTQQNAKFSGEQYAMILNFLEDPQNMAKVCGVAGKTEVGVAPPRKIEAWKELAALINNRFKGKYTLDHKSVADRWRTYLNKYRLARERSMSTGFGVTEADKKRNIHTVQAKLDSMCPHYQRIHALFGERPNVSPAATFDSGSITSEVDLNKVLRFSVEDSETFVNEVLPTAPVPPEGTSEFDEIAAYVPYANEEAMTYSAMLFTDGEDAEMPHSPPTEATGVAAREDDNVSVTDLESSPTVVAGGKRQPRVEPSDSKKAKKDRRKELPSLCAMKNPTQSRNFLAQSIQEGAAAKAAALVCIEEKRLKFEQMKWDAEREEREVRRKEEEKEREVRRKEEEQRRMEDKEEERNRRAEEKAEKFKERRFVLLQALMTEGKSPDEIEKMLKLLL